MSMSTFVSTFTIQSECSTNMLRYVEGMSAAENRQDTSRDLYLCFAKKEKYNTSDPGTNLKMKF